MADMSDTVPAQPSKGSRESARAYGIVGLLMTGSTVVDVRIYAGCELCCADRWPLLWGHGDRSSLTSVTSRYQLLDRPARLTASRRLDRVFPFPSSVGGDVSRAFYAYQRIRFNRIAVNREPAPRPNPTGLPTGTTGLDPNDVAFICLPLPLPRGYV